MEENQVNLQFIEPIDEKSDEEEIKELLKDGKAKAGVEMLLEEMLRFLGEMPFDRHHDYRTFRHGGLRRYLITLFLREKGG